MGLGPNHAPRHRLDDPGVGLDGPGFVVWMVRGSVRMIRTCRAGCPDVRVRPDDPASSGGLLFSCRVVAGSSRPGSGSSRPGSGSSGLGLDHPDGGLDRPSKS